MKKILIKKMKICNFKGIKELEVNFDGSNFSVFGANGVGKTTLVDAFCWCLWGKDSRNQADFDIKTIVNGVPMSKAEHSVELTLLNGDKEICFGRIFVEKWTKPRGAIEFEFKGHETKYTVNCEPLTQRQFNDIVATLIDNKVFALLSNPLYFNETLKWEERREILMKLAGDISVQDIIGHNSKLSDLLKMSEAEIMTQKKISDSQATKIRKEIADIPVRISELQRMLPQTNNEFVNKEYYQKAQNRLTEIHNELFKLNQQKAFVSTKTFDEAEEIKELQVALQKQQLMDSEYKAKISKDFHDKALSLLDSLQEETIKLKELDGKNNWLTTELTVALATKQSLLEKYHNLKNTEFQKAEINDICPTCKQKLPQEDVDMAFANYEKARKEFNINKSNSLTNIIEEGKSNNELIASLETKVKEVQSELNAQKDVCASADADYKQANKIYVEHLTSSADSQATIEIKLKIANMQENSKAMINQFAMEMQKQIDALDNQIDLLDQEAKQLSSNMSLYEQYVKCQNRIMELEETEAVLNTTHETHRVMSWKCEQFLLAKINYINKLILGKFSIADFVLFRKNISNDGIEQCCDTIVNGVPYKSVNDAARINVGMDIISTLIDYYGVAVPIFVDNAESVTDLNMIEGKTQIIRLVVSKPDSVLRFVKE